MEEERNKKQTEEQLYDDYQDDNYDNEQQYIPRKKKRGFTLIELLAVVIILGILMVVAVPAVTSYVSSSRKEAYVNIAKEVTNGARNTVNEGSLGMYDKDTTYYIESDYIKVENGPAKSPYGEFERAYTIVTFDGHGYTYYWTSVDETGEGVKGIVRADSLNSDDIESDIKLDDVQPNVSIGSRSKIVIIRADGTIEYGTVKYNIPETGAKWGEIGTSVATGTATGVPIEIATGTSTETGTSTGWDNPDSNQNVEVATGTATANQQTP